ncbi:MAG: acyl carrier protein [Streptococcaceae bacterium]|jgi:acyl carrier protein|nr:acyl carrier protein [Streptococcaceae bacterium]
MEIEARVKETVGQVMKIDNEEITDVNLNDNLVNDLDFDSVRTLILAASLEEQFDMNFDEENFAIIKTVADIVYFIEENKSEK